MSPTPLRAAALTNTTMSAADDLAGTSPGSALVFRFWPRGGGTSSDELADGSELADGLAPDVPPEAGIFPPGYSPKSCSNMKKAVGRKLFGPDDRHDDVLRSQIVSPVEFWPDPGMRRNVLDTLHIYWFSNQATYDIYLRAMSTLTKY